MCGNSYGECDPEANIPPILIAIIIVSSIFCLLICLTCCLRAQREQRLRNTYMNSNGQIITNPHQQSIYRGPRQNSHLRPVYHIGAVPSMHAYPIYEAPPPSYEVATASLSVMHPTSSSPVVTPVQESV